MKLAIGSERSEKALSRKPLPLKPCKLTQRCQELSSQRAGLANVPAGAQKHFDSVMHIAPYRVVTIRLTSCALFHQSVEFIN